MKFIIIIIIHILFFPRSSYIIIHSYFNIEPVDAFKHSTGKCFILIFIFRIVIKTESYINKKYSLYVLTLVYVYLLSPQVHLSNFATEKYQIKFEYKFSFMIQCSRQFYSPSPLTPKSYFCLQTTSSIG